MKPLVLGSKPSDLNRQLSRPSNNWSVSNLDHGKCSIHSIEEFPIGIISDIHGKYQYAQAAINEQPEVKQWFCLGDVVDYSDRFKTNQDALKWWMGSNIPTILGNHDRDFAYAFRTEHKLCHDIMSLPRNFRLLFPTGVNILGYHSLPGDMVTFVDPGFTEREFVDGYTTIDEDTAAVIIGHNHKQFKQVYYGCRTELWSVGSVGYFGEYATIDLNGIHFHRIHGIKK